MKRLKILICAGILGIGDSAAQALFDQTATLYNTNTQRGVNWQSERGVPTSAVAGNPAGSDGRNSMTPSAPTAGQFRGIITYSAVAKKGNLAAGVSGTTFAENAGPLNWPRSTAPNGSVVYILRANAGAPVFSKQVLTLYGSMIPLPNTDMGGSLLGEVQPASYWYPEPFWPNINTATLEHTGAPYYWSPHARAVFAVKPGPIEVTWRLATPVTAQPVDYVPNVTHVFLGGGYYPLKKITYIVSGLPVKTPRKMYWTEGNYQDLGRLVQVPAGRVKEVKFQFNPLFPERVATKEEIVQPYGRAIGEPDEDEIPYRTIFVENNFIHAYNREGRVFMELLGDANEGAARQHLGIEIIDVLREAIPGDVTTELGERVTAFPGNVPSDAGLTPVPINQDAEAPFAYQHNLGNANQVQFFATRVTANVSDYQVHWLEKGIEGLLWPARFSRYQFIWPTDPAKYSHYVRPIVIDENAAKLSAVKLPISNAPFIEYEDPSDRKRAALTEDFSFYTFLDVSFPRHRTLLRYNAGEFVAFERVFSILESTLRDSAFDPSLFAGSYFDVDPTPGGAYGEMPAGVYFDGNAFTIEAWVNLRSVRPWARIIEFAAGPTQDNVSFGLSEDGTRIPFLEIRQGGVSQIARAATPIPLQQWAHLAVVFDPGIAAPDHNAKFYLNGIAIGGGRVAAPANVNRALNRLGRSALNDPADAMFDNVRLWSVARSETQIKDGMQTPISSGTPGLALEYRFDETTSNMAADSSGGGRPLTIVNGNITAALRRSRFIQSSAWVGERLNPPPGETSSTLDHPSIAGYVHQPGGKDFSVTAYRDPFVVGFNEAAEGSIIPVNAGNDNRSLEVWWFRPNHADPAKGFKTAYWPSVIARYSLRWPTAAPFSRDIVMASNDGSGALTSRESVGALYIQNDPSSPGYNPNEEHALMQGGQVFALRDDLNITDPAGITFDALRPYSSHPYVLLQYSDEDNRPSMSVFRVLREQGEDAFEYKVTAGTILQPPMPLPLMEPPFAPKYIGEPPRSVNMEVPSMLITSSSTNATGDTSVVHVVTASAHAFSEGDRLSLQTGTQAPKFFYVVSADRVARKLDGYVAASEPLQISQSPASQPGPATRIRFGLKATEGLTVGGKVIVRSPFVSHNWLATIYAVNASPMYVELELSIPRPPEMLPANELAMVTKGTVPSSTRLYFEPVLPEVGDEATAQLYGRVTLQDRKGNIWVYRGPKDENEEAFTAMKFFYKTLPGFYFPSRPFGSQPEMGTITPYLRPQKETIVEGQDHYAGDPVTGTSLQTQVVGAEHALAIRYNAVWPDTAPVLYMAETLTTPKRGLPAVRGQTSLQLLYQQSIHRIRKPSAILHDPTREKEYRLNSGLNKIPDSVARNSYRGKIYFPGLPPHLAERFFFDPDRGALGALVFKGQFMDEALGDDYLLLNVLGSADTAALAGLCLLGDPLKTAWDQVFFNGNMQTTLELFVENPGRLGTYMPSAPANVGGTSISQIVDDDQAVDSYALTAQGPGAGYITLIGGNGLAFTPVNEPVTMQVIKVVKELYRGEVKIVQSSNPLNEKLTLQQVVDLAGEPSKFEAEWMITAPVDGAPPLVYSNSPALLMGDGSWTHLSFPKAGDNAINAHNAAAARLVSSVDGEGVAPVSSIPFASIEGSTDVEGLSVTLPATTTLTGGNHVRLVQESGAVLPVAIDSISDGPTRLTLTGGPNDVLPAADDIIEVAEAIVENVPQSILFRTFQIPTDKHYSQVYLSLDLDLALGAKVYIDGDLVVTANLGEDDTPLVTPPPDFGPLARVYRVNPQFSETTDHRIAIELFSSAQPGTLQRCKARIEAYEAHDLTSDLGSPWLLLDPIRYPDKVRANLGGTADVRSLADNYLIMRYRASDPNHAAYKTNVNNVKQGWSAWTEPQLAEGWIKRVLAGINPFNQRISDLFNNRVNTDVSILTQAGQRWEGDVALNLENMNNFGLIEIYETVLRRGRMLSIDAGINYGPANDALLLAAGYLNDLYMLLGNEAWADSANPTIGIGTKDHTYGEIATALFAFKGQVPSLLEEELALLRGRDDFLQPGVEVAPVYNRLVWNYTRGIDSGEVIYALNYNIQENNDTGVNGVINADDARKMFPQGHGDAYGHFLTAIKGYYLLMMDTDFDWVPRSEAVTVLGKPVQVDYQDERKFAAAAAALARSGRQIFDLTWRKDFAPGADAGWEHLSSARDGGARPLRARRYWGADHWASRTGQGAYYNWALGNAILPATDTLHEGIQKIDRTTVPELAELVTTAKDLQSALDNAEAHQTPLGLPPGALVFDINPTRVGGASPETHFEQVYNRARGALNNALIAFDDAKDVTRLLRSEQDSLADFQASVAQQEKAFENSLIELYGTPYADDVGPGRTYKQGYAGPDLLHYMYVEIPESPFNGAVAVGLNQTRTFKIDIQANDPLWPVQAFEDFRFLIDAATAAYTVNQHYVDFQWGPHGFYGKPAQWGSRRGSPGRLQQAISNLIKAHENVRLALFDAENAKGDLDKAIQVFKANIDTRAHLREVQLGLTTAEELVSVVEFATKVVAGHQAALKGTIVGEFNASLEAFPKFFIAGLANGGDLTAAARSFIKQGETRITNVLDRLEFVKNIALDGLKFSAEASKRWTEFFEIAPEERRMELREAVIPLGDALSSLQRRVPAINQQLRLFEDAQREVKSLEAQGQRSQAQREVFRQRAAAVVQGFRTRDAAFRIFRAEKLERYKTLFDLSSRYSYLAANAFDYETGLLGSPKGKEFVNRIVNSRALGVFRNGEPQFAGSNMGDPGLSSALAEMKADWDTLKGRLGFNNPASYGTTVSLRTENERIINGPDGLSAWRDVLSRSRRSNIGDDDDVKRYCLQVERGDGQPSPGFIIEFSTTVAQSHNLFGRQLAGGDHYFPPSAFATKIFGVGVALEGYVGMDNPVANSTVVTTTGSTSPSDPTTTFLNSQALAATPGIYLIPVGVDVMRSPPLGDSSVTRHWTVNDVAIPMPFNIGGSEFSTAALWQSSDSLTEPLFAIRKHGEFRPVSTTSAFAAVQGIGERTLSQYTNNRLIGRSVWNTKWKLVIPGHNLLFDPDEGLERFLNTVTDIKLHFITYSYSGN